MSYTVNDANGNPISVGSVIKIDAVVTAIDPFSAHYGELEIAFTYPLVNTILPSYGLGFNSSIADGTTSTPGIMKRSILKVPTKVPPSMVVVGS